MADKRTRSTDNAQSAASVRSRCVGCGQAVAAEVRTCPWCGRELLYDVVVPDAVSAGAAMRAARDLAMAEFGDRQQLTERLGAAPGAVVLSTTRAKGLECQEHLAHHGVSAHLEPVPLAVSRDRPDRKHRPPWWQRPRVLAVVGVAVLVVAQTVVRHVLFREDEEPQPGPRRSGAVVVERTTPGTEGVERALGFFAPGGVLVTTARAAGETGARLHVDGNQAAYVRGIDDWLGIAVAAPVGNTRPLELGDASLVQAGDRLLLPGTRVGAATVVDPAAVVMGLVFMRVDAVVHPSATGAPVLNRAGQVVGVLMNVTVGFDDQALVLPVNYLVDEPDPLLPDLADAVDLDRWRTRLTDSGVGELRQAENLLHELEQPFLLKATLHARRRLTAVVGRLSTGVPVPSPLEFVLLHDGDRRCTIEAAVPRWQPASPEQAGVEVPPQTRWLEHHGHFMFLFMAEVSTNVRGCGKVEADAATLVLGGGLATVDRATVEPVVRRPRRSREGVKFLRQAQPSPTPSSR